MEQPSFPSTPPPAPGADDHQQRYDRLLTEAASIRGVSLWQDAWKRLRRNWSAMLSLYFLLTLGVLAFFTPLLPLQSPIKQNLRDASAEDPEQSDGRQFQSPNFRSVSLGIARYRAKMQELQAELDQASGEKRQAIEDQIERYENDNPLREMANHPGWLTRQMINARIALFGDYCLPSLMGTDNLGRDVMARIFWGSRVSIIVALVAAFVSLVIGVTYGATSGYLGGLVDSLMMRFVDILYSIPFIFVVIFIITILSDEKVKPTLDKVGINQIIILYVLIGAIYWLTMARVVRGQVISLKTEQYIEAARTIGASTWRIVLKHLIPNVLGVVIVYLTLTIPAVMLFEAFLSFLGLGVTPPDVSWGILVNEGVQAITPIKVYWWLVLFPGLVFSLTLFALNFLGDGLRDALDPRLKNK
jgi:oligopeptide transport system permease protein